jgi:hypothetical protein
MITVTVAIAVIAAIALRIYPHQFSSKDLGVDQWFWKVYIKTYRQERQFPPVLPQYLLDKHQWYPPLFPLLIGNLPKALFDRYSYLVAILIDIIRMLLVLGAFYWLAGGNVYAVGIAWIVYATTPILISYNIQLNPRGLGALFLDGLVILLTWYYYFNGPFWVWAVVLFLSGLILLTHKMTTQLFWFLCLGAGVLKFDWRPLALIPLSILIALLLSKGFYWKVLRAHWDIVTFWNRNWRWLQAHPIRESPLYGEPGYETPSKFYRKGLNSIIKHLSSFCVLNPTAWVLIVFFFVNVFTSGDLKPFSYWLLWYSVLTIFFALTTVFINLLKCLGAGYLYLYNVSLPVAVLWSLVLTENHKGFLGWSLFIVAIILNFISILILYHKILTSKTNRIDSDLERAFTYLKNAPKGAVVCLPPQWYDAVAYKTGQPVLYGGHGYGFKLLESFFPRLMLSIKEVIKKYHLRYIITLDGYLPAKFISEIPFERVESIGQYRIYILAQTSFSRHTSL